MTSPDASEPSSSSADAARDVEDSASLPVDVRRATERRHALLVAVVVGIVGVVGTLLGSWIQIDGAERSQRTEFLEERAKEDRTTRADAYLEFLSAAKEYVVYVDQVQMCLSDFVNRPPRMEDGSERQLPPECDEPFKALAKPRRALDQAADRVYVYGSSEAWRRAYAVSDYLPDALGWRTWGTHYPKPDRQIFEYNEAYFGLLYSKFQRVACEELPAHPRPNC